MEAYFIGVDVGTGSVRAALLSESGKLIKHHSEAIKCWNIQQDFYEQSSDDIWKAVSSCVQSVVKCVDNLSSIKGIGFDATCSLVCIDKNGKPLTISPSGNNVQNVILWLDHRATKETDSINQLNHPILNYVGGKVFPEMEIPKLLWLKNHLNRTWENAGYFMDLPDFLTWKATNVDTRSSCSLVCKWLYEMNTAGIESWNKDFFTQLNLTELADDNWKKIGSTVQYPGEPVGKGLSEQAAKDLGLLVGTAVATSMIDAHAGGLGLIGCRVDGIDSNFDTRIGLICGTSTCHMAVSHKPIFVPGVWGPYKNAMLSGMWLNEGGQSATGKLIDHIIETHPATNKIRKKVGGGMTQIIEYLNNLLLKMAKIKGLGNIAFLTKDLHVYPDFHGCRLMGDPTLKGMISGLTLACDEENLAVLYLATVQALSYGTRHIIDQLRKYGYKNIKSISICGGLSKNRIFTAAQANACNLPVICPDENESVLLGSAILGAVASKHFTSLKHAIQSMSGDGTAILPNEQTLSFHDRKYKIYRKMYEDQIEYRSIMEDKESLVKL